MLFAIFSLGFDPIKNALIWALKLFLPGKIGTALIIAIPVLMIILSVIQWKKLLTVRFIIGWCIWSFYLIASVLLCSQDQNLYYLETAKSIFLCYPMILIGKELYNCCESQEKNLIILSSIINISLLVNYLTSGNSFSTEYSQYFGYEALTSAVLSLCFIFSRFNLLHIFNFIASCFFILISGSRGPILCIGLAGILCVIQLSKQRGIKKYLIFGALASVSAYLYFEYKNIALKLYSLFQKIGASTRILRWILSITKMGNGRDSVAKVSLQKIQNDPFNIMGAFSDRIYIKHATFEGVRSATSVGMYPHNIFLEWLLQFGVVFGGILIILLLASLIIGFISQKSTMRSVMFCLLCSIGLFPLFVSGSYISWSSFFVLIGYVSKNILNEYVTNRKKAQVTDSVIQG